MEAGRYDQLRRTRPQHELDALRLVRVHPAFRVIAITVPVPPYVGNPLDPPLRSRFQARVVLPIRPEVLVSLSRSVPATPPSEDALAAVNDFAQLMYKLSGEGKDHRHVPELSVTAVLSVARLLTLFPAVDPLGLLNRAFPWRHVVFEEETREALESALTRPWHPDQPPQPLYTLGAVRRTSTPNTALANFRLVRGFGASDGEGVTVETTMGQGQAGFGNCSASLTWAQQKLLGGIAQSHAGGRHVCILGERGEGKSFVARAFASKMSTRPKKLRRFLPATQGAAHVKSFGFNRTSSCSWRVPVAGVAVHQSQHSPP